MVDWFIVSPLHDLFGFSCLKFSWLKLSTKDLFGMALALAPAIAFVQE